jgi:hypothetical protein
MNLSHLRLDSADSIFLERQLQFMESSAYSILRPELKARTIIPVRTDADPAAEKIFYRMRDKVGEAKVIVNYGDDFPRVNMSQKEYSQPIVTLGDSFEVSVWDLRRAQKEGMNLDSDLAVVARDVALNLEDKLAAFGDSAYGFEGFVNHSAVTATNAALNAGATSREWANKTVEEILKDLNAPVAAIRNATNGVEAPTDYLLDEESYTLIAQKHMSVDNSATVLQFFLGTNPWVKSITPWYHLKSAGASSTRRLLAYKKDPSKVTLWIPQDFQLDPEQRRNQAIIVNGSSRFGGVTLRYPKSMYYLDGI